MLVLRQRQSSQMLRTNVGCVKFLSRQQGRNYVNLIKQNHESMSSYKHITFCTYRSLYPRISATTENTFDTLVFLYRPHPGAQNV